MTQRDGMVWNDGSACLSSIYALNIQLNNLNNHLTLLIRNRVGQFEKHTRMTFSNGPLSSNCHCIHSIVMIAMTRIEFSRKFKVCVVVELHKFHTEPRTLSLQCLQLSIWKGFVINAESAFHYFIGCSMLLVVWCLDKIKLHRHVYSVYVRA